MYKPDWSELPRELVAKISEHLNDKVNVLRFRAVCTTFRSSANLVPPLALKLPSPIKSINNEETPSRFCVLLETTIYAVRLRNEAGNGNGGGGGDDSQVWVIKVEGKIGKQKVVQLVNPLSRVQIKPLPRKFPKVFQLLDFHVVELCKEYVLKHPLSELQEAYLVQIPNSQYSVEVKELYVGEVDVKKVVVLSSNANLPTNDDVYGVMVLCREGNLAVFKPKENQKWDVLDGYRFRDVVSYNGNFYAVDSAGRAVVIDANLELNVVAEPPVTVGSGTDKRLVISDGNLFLVDVSMYWGSDDSAGDENGEQTESDDEEIPLVLDYEAIPCEFEVYKLDECNQRWIGVEDLGGRVFVIGERSSFSVWPRDLSRIKGNCILFMDGLYTSYGAEEDREIYIHNTGLFSLEDKKIGLFGSFPSYNQLFWPPPSWIMPN